MVTGYREILKNRFGLLALFFILFIVFSLLIRTVLLIKSWPFLNPTIWLLMKIYGVGLFYDLITTLYFSIPLVFYLIFIPDKIFLSQFHKPFLYIFLFTTIYVLVFDSVAEYFFFEEFGTRFNFIALDYLIYTRELIHNAKESYPLFPLLIGMAILSFLWVLLMRKWIDRFLKAPSNLTQRLKQGWIFFVLPLLPLLFVDLSLTRISTNPYANELSSNGIYDFFAAFQINQIDYVTFYRTKDNKEVFQNLRVLLKEKNNTFISEDLFDITREIKNPANEKRLNIALILVESLSADYLGVFGNQKNLTPNLDQLSKESLFFTHLYATGTRTDRGIESITLSIPPTPGRSIVKRPHNENLFSWGLLMKSKGYDTKFIYAGYGYFDNMNYFFSHNGFEIIDRKNFSKNEISFENAWGVCDEDLYHKSMKEFDKSLEKRSPFFAIILTTSNHRPFTYPDGRINIPSHTGRRGAVKYTDYAIGKFIREAKEKPWFKDTLFIIVADHCAGSAGKTALPIKRYEIPFFIYSPDHVSPQRIDRLVSQIDIAPTVLGLLNFSYTSKFFGKDILKMETKQERAFISTYQRLGFMKKDRLVALDLKKEINLFQTDDMTGEEKKIPADQNLFDEAISYYQAADYLFQHHLNRWNFDQEN
jgi:phosphoglycerol transferase MdoB-like AlkP superfamily enzyme